MLEERVRRSGKRVDTSSKAKESKPPPKEVEEPKVKPVEAIPQEPDDMEIEDLEEVPEQAAPDTPPPPPKPRGEFYINYEALLPVHIPSHVPMETVDTSELTDFNIPSFNFKYNPVEQNLEGINYNTLDYIDFELVEKIGNLRHPIISTVIETVSEINAMLKDTNQVLKFEHYVNNLVMSATSQLTHFPTGDDDQETALYRAMLGILMQSVNNDRLSAKISTKYISRVFRLFLPVLADDHRANSNVDVLVKGVNTLICRLLMNCNTGAATCSLVSYMDSILDDRGLTKAHKELEILMKCLWKLMARIEKDFTLTIAERHDLLICLAKFLQRLPSQVWKDNHENDKPYRTIKTLIHRLCKCSGMRVLSDLQTLSPDDRDTLKVQVDAFLTALGYDVTSPHAINTGSEQPSGSDKENLDLIFEGINNVKEVRQSIKKLHRFKEDRPMVDISTYLNRLPEMKRKLVEKILADMKKTKVNKDANKLRILAEKEGICMKELTDEQLQELKKQPLSNIFKDSRKILEHHRTAFKDDNLDNLINILPKDNVRAEKPKNVRSIPRPGTSPGRSPVRAGAGAGGQIPSRSMDDLKKRLELIKKRSKPT